LVKTSPLLPLYVVAYHPRSYIVELGDVYVEDWMPYEEWAMREDMYPTSYNANYNDGQTMIELPYVAEQMRVNINGINMPEHEYTVSGNRIVFNNPPIEGDVIIVVPFDGRFVHRTTF